VRRPSTVSLTSRGPPMSNTKCASGWFCCPCTAARRARPSPQASSRFLPVVHCGSADQCAYDSAVKPIIYVALAGSALVAASGAASASTRAYGTPASGCRLHVGYAGSTVGTGNVFAYFRITNRGDPNVRAWLVPLRAPVWSGGSVDCDE